MPHDLTDAAMLEIIGVRMIHVPDLGTPLLLLRRGLVLVDDALDEDQVAAVVDQVLSLAAESLASA